MRAVLPFVFASIAAVAARAQVVESWRAQVDHSPWHEFPEDALVSAAGETTYFGVEQTGPVVSPGFLGPSGASVVRVGALGNVIWSNRFDGPGAGPHDVRFHAGALDSQGGCAGAAQSFALPLPAAIRDLHVVRYDASGTQLWATAVPQALPIAITIASDGQVWVAGRLEGGGPSDVVIWRFGANGSLLSTAIWNGTLDTFDEPTAIEPDGAGGVYVVGSTNANGSTRQRMLLRVGPAGDVLWARTDGVAPARALDLVVDASGVYVASTVGAFRGKLAKYDSSGATLWERDVTDVVAGYTPTFVARAENGDVVAGGGHQTVVARRFDPSGTLLWSSVVTTGVNQAARAVELDQAGDVVCVGVAEPGAGSISSAFVAKLDGSSGAVRWVRVVPNSFAIDGGTGPSGSAFLVASFFPADPPDRDVLVVRFDDWIVPFCAGDGAGTACPCGNAGADGHGCANSVSTAGALLAATGAPLLSGDTLVLQGSGMTNGSVLYFQGTTQSAGGAGTVFGDGLRCAAGAVVRLGTKANVGGASSYPEALDPPVSVRGGVVGGMQTRTYQAWYRNSAAFCTPSGFNLTNGLSVIWTP